MTTIASAASSAAVNAVGTAPSATGNTAERAALHKAAQSFEAIMVRQMLGTARQTNFGDDLWGEDQGKDTFDSMRDERTADVVSQSGALGLAQQIERQLGVHLNGTPDPTATKA
jgi:peptidoglycan hydrolase FlgJ